MLSQLSRQKKSDGSLDLTGCYGRPKYDDNQQHHNGQYPPLVVMSKFASLRRNPLEQVVDERVHNRHGLRGDSSVRMHLLQDLRNNF